MISTTQIIHPTLYLEGAVVAHPRPRFSRRSGRAYMPDNYRSWMAIAVDALQKQWALEPLTGPTEARLIFLVECPKSRLKKSTKNKRIPKDTAPDLDNLIKSVLDALQSAEILKNDSCIYRIAGEKWYGAISDGHHTIIQLSTHKKAAWAATPGG